MKSQILKIIGITLPISIIFASAHMLLTGCKGDPKQTTERIYLRQMNTGTAQTTKASGSFFVVFGTYNSESKMVYKLRALGNFRGEYRFLDLDLNYVSFKLDSSATVPHIVVEYERMQPYPDMLEYFDYLFILRMDNPRYVVTCHPDLVPQQIQQVKL
jgi:hypothetical protein